jgi:hypothetical protein
MLLFRMLFVFRITKRRKTTGRLDSVEIHWKDKLNIEGRRQNQRRNQENETEGVY